MIEGAAEHKAFGLTTVARGSIAGIIVGHEWPNCSEEEASFGSHFDNLPRVAVASLHTVCLRSSLTPAQCHVELSVTAEKPDSRLEEIFEKTAVLCNVSLSPCMGKVERDSVEPRC